MVEQRLQLLHLLTSLCTWWLLWRYSKPLAVPSAIKHLCRQERGGLPSYVKKSPDKSTAVSLRNYVFVVRWTVFTKQASRSSKDPFAMKAYTIHRCCSSQENPTMSTRFSCFNLQSKHLIKADLHYLAAEEQEHFCIFLYSWTQTHTFRVWISWLNWSRNLFRGISSIWREHNIFS